MAKARQIYDQYLRNLRQEHPRHEPLMRAAIDAFDTIQARKKTTSGLLQPIVEAASDSQKKLFDIAVSFLDQLTGKYEQAREAVSKMSEDKRSHTRFNAITCVGKRSPKSFKLKLLRTGLRDKSAKVRSKSADWALRQRLSELVPELEQALAVEKNPKARSTMQFCLKLLRDGYILETEKDGLVCVTTFTADPSVICSTHCFERSELKRRGIDAIVAEINSDSDP